MNNKEFEHFALSGNGQDRARALEIAFDELLDTVKAQIADGRYLSLVKTKLEEAFAFANRGIVSEPSNTSRG